MKKIIFLFCFITLFACSKSEDITLVPDNRIKVSHITNDDLVLVEGLVQLNICKEEAINRGVSASEYDLVEETLSRFNTEKVQTRSMNTPWSYGILEYPANSTHSNSAGPINIYQSLSGNGVSLSYMMGSGNEGSNTLCYHLYGITDPIHDDVYSYGQSSGVIPFPSFEFGWMTLDYSYEGSGQGICYYEIFN